MPSTNKRVNLTLTNEVYEKLQKYKRNNGILSDATACLQLVVQKLNEQDNAEEVKRLMRELSPEQIFEMSKMGLSEMKIELDKE